MPTDIAPALLERIKADFERRVAENSTIKAVANRIRDGTSTLADAHKYAERLGEILSDALIANLTEDALPDGRLYWNIADRTIRPMLENNHALTNATAAEIQAVVDKAANVGLSAIQAKLPEDRIKGLIEKAVEAKTFEDMIEWLGEPVVNCSASFFDDFVQTNARARNRAGMAVTIERRLGSSELRSIRRGKTSVKYQVPCQWCQSMSGEFPYNNLPDDIFRRHEFCRCVVTYKNGKKRQDVWGKKEWWAEDPADLKARKTYGIELKRR